MAQVRYSKTISQPERVLAAMEHCRTIMIDAGTKVRPQGPAYHAVHMVTAAKRSNKMAAAASRDMAFRLIVAFIFLLLECALHSGAFTQPRTRKSQPMRAYASATIRASNLEMRDVSNAASPSPLGLSGSAVGYGAWGTSHHIDWDRRV